jgi:hypothetical protein
VAEVGLLAFARTALEVGRAVLPPYRTRFSKHQFTQPQLLAFLCLMRHEDWTFREAEVRLGEHRELRQALGLSRVPRVAGAGEGHKPRGRHTSPRNPPRQRPGPSPQVHLGRECSGDFISPPSLSVCPLP